MLSFRDAIRKRSARPSESQPQSSTFAQAMRQARPVAPAPSEKDVLQALQVLLTHMVR